MARHRIPQGQEGLQVLVGSPAYYFGLGDVLREWDDLEAAEEHLMQGVDEVGGTLTVDAGVVTLGYMSLARLKQARGDYDGALATLHAFTQLAHQGNFVPYLEARGAAMQALIELRQSNLDVAACWAVTSGLSPDDDLNFLREVEYLTLARVRIAQGRDDPKGLFLKDALRLLERLLHDAEGKARMNSVIEILTLYALAFQAQGDSVAVLNALERAVARAREIGLL